MTMDDTQSDIDISLSWLQTALRPQQQRLESLIRRILHHFEINSAQVSIAVVNDAEIQQIHQEFFGKATVTDVISFNLSDEHQPCRSFEIIVNADQAGRQANLKNHTPLAELALYITHGLLHNLGYDDATANDAQQMHTLEDQLLEQNGYGKVYYTTDNPERT